jgi:hypothetical protein
MPFPSGLDAGVEALILIPATLNAWFGAGGMLCG